MAVNADQSADEDVSPLGATVLRRADLEELPLKIRRSVTFVAVESMEKVLAPALVAKEKGADSSCADAGAAPVPV